MYLKVSLSSIFLAVHLRKIIFLTIKLYIYIIYFQIHLARKNSYTFTKNPIFGQNTLYLYYIYSGTLGKKKQTSG